MSEIITKIVNELKQNNVNPRLIVSDLDGTLLTPLGEVPNSFWKLHDKLTDLNILFSPASGRQYTKIEKQFSKIKKDTVFIAENGTFVVQNDFEISSESIPSEYAVKVVNYIKKTHPRSKVIICSKLAAFVDDSDNDFNEQISQYYYNLKVFKNIKDIGEQIIKIAIYSPHDYNEEVIGDINNISNDYVGVLSGETWIDVISKKANKGLAVQEVMKKFNIKNEEVFVFGDYLNDLEMIQNAIYSFAPETAHPTIKKYAKFIIPSNVESGVMQILNTFFE